VASRASDSKVRKARARARVRARVKGRTVASRPAMAAASRVETVATQQVDTTAAVHGEAARRGADGGKVGKFA